MNISSINVFIDLSNPPWRWFESLGDGCGDIHPGCIYEICPANVNHWGLMNFVLHLNDDHDLSFSQIARVLEDRGLDVVVSIVEDEL